MLNGASSNIPPEMTVVMVCDKMRWTLQEYDAQPMSFINMLILKWNEDARYQNAQNKLE